MKGLPVFKNRSVQVKVVKDGITDEPDTTVGDCAYILSVVADKAVKGVAGLMLIYVATDTVRQIAVHTAKVKIK